MEKFYCFGFVRKLVEIYANQKTVELKGVITTVYVKQRLRNLWRHKDFSAGTKERRRKTYNFNLSIYAVPRYSIEPFARSLVCSFVWHSWFSDWLWKDQKMWRETFTPDGWGTTTDNEGISIFGILRYYDIYARPDTQWAACERAKQINGECQECQQKCFLFCLCFEEKLAKLRGAMMNDQLAGEFLVREKLGEIQRNWDSERRKLSDNRIHVCGK